MTKTRQLKLRKRQQGRRNLAIGCGTVILAGGIASTTNAGTVLTQDGDWSTNDRFGEDIFNYGDNVPADTTAPEYDVYEGIGGITGTPDIDLTWDGTFDSYQDWNGRGNVIQPEDYDPAGAGANNVIFTPTANIQARLVSFDIDAWAGGGDISVDWSVTGDLSGELAGGTWDKSNAGGRDTIDLEVIGEAGEALALTLDQTAGSGSYLAIDNIDFDQIEAVPEPSTAVLAVTAGLGLAAMLRRRRNRA